MATWFECDFTGGALGAPVDLTSEPNFSEITFAGTYAEVPGTDDIGVLLRSTSYSEYRVDLGERTTFRVGVKVYVYSWTEATGYYYLVGLRDGTGSRGTDLGLRGVSGTRRMSLRDEYTYVGEATDNLVVEDEIWSVEFLREDGGDITAYVWRGPDTSGVPLYTWTGNDAVNPTQFWFGPAGNTGVSAIVFDVWATDGERRENTPAVPNVRWAHNGSSRQDRFLVSARVENADSVALEYSLSDDFSNSDVTPVTTEALTTDGNYHLEAEGLSPGSTYYWRLIVNDEPTSVTGETKTLPNSSESLRVVWGSCYWSNASGVFPLIANRDPDLVMLLGDDGYTFYSNGETNPDPGQPYPAPANTALIRSIRDEVFTRAGRRLVTGKFPIEHMYSDTDGLGGNMDSTQGAPSNVQEAWRQMYAHYLDDETTGFRTFVVGRVRFIVVDENTASMAKNSPQSPSKSKLGLTQKALLFDALDQATQDKQFVLLFGDGPWLGATDTQLNDTGNGYNKYNHERTEIGEYVEMCISEGMLGFHRYHGDDHTLYGDSGANNNWGGFPVYCAAPMNETSNTGTTATYDAGKWPTSVEEAGPTRQYGVLDLTDDGTTITIRSRGFSSTSSNPTEVTRYDQTLTYTEEAPETPIGIPFGTIGGKTAYLSYVNAEGVRVSPQSVTM